MAKQSPTSRTLQYLRAQGIRAGVVERWNPHAFVRQDLFGFIDLVALYPGEGIVGIQVTTDGGMAARRRKILEERAEEARAWVEAGGIIEVWGWGQKGPSGKRKVWVPRVERIGRG
jgi:hypothetical protein